MRSEAELPRSDVVLTVLAASLLLLCFACGGDSARFNPGVAAAQLLAIPILVLAVVECARGDRFQSSSMRWGVVAATLIVLLPMLQLLPLPLSIWSLPTERVLLLQDMEAAGVVSGDHRWTLSPAATERDLLFLLPGISLFFCMLALGRSAWIRMFGLIIAICIGNLIFASVQMSAGKDSPINLYPQFVPGMGGVFANKNHQASLLAIGMIVVTVFLLGALRGMRENGQSGASTGALAFIAVLLFAILPLTGSRAGVIIAMILFMGAVLSSGLPTVRRFRESRLLQVGSVLAIVIFAIGLYAALAWTSSDANDASLKASRYGISSETLAIGSEHAPLGAGIGTFIPAFKQGASDDYLMTAFVNNAHNEYAQWWLEGGIVAVFVVLLALATLLMTLVRLLRQRAGSRTRTCGIAAMMGIGVVVLHSSVDYPLRTPALMAVFAVLSGIAIAAAARGSSSTPRNARAT